MLQKKHKTNRKLGKTKCMNCVILAIVAILAIVIHFVNNYLQEEIKIYPKLSTGGSPTKQRIKGRKNKNTKR